MNGNAIPPIQKQRCQQKSKVSDLPHSTTLNTLLWGAKSWNLNKANQNKLATFCHSAIRYILNIKWEQLREQKISSEEVRSRFKNITEINFFITRHTWMCMEKSSMHQNTLSQRSSWEHGYTAQEKQGILKHCQKALFNNTQDSLT